MAAEPFPEMGVFAVEILLQGGILAAELKTTHGLMILQGGILAAELNTIYGLIILQGSILASELNTTLGLMILQGGLLAAELNKRPDGFARWYIGSGANRSS